MRRNGGCIGSQRWVARRRPWIVPGLNRIKQSAGSSSQRGQAVSAAVNPLGIERANFVMDSPHSLVIDSGDRLFTRLQINGEQNLRGQFIQLCLALFARETGLT